MGKCRRALRVSPAHAHTNRRQRHRCSDPQAGRLRNRALHQRHRNPCRAVGSKPEHQLGMTMVQSKGDRL